MPERVLTTGCFGKVPARGDFLQRGLPRGFVDPWHEWVRVGLHESRRMLGDGWLDRYLNAPIWRFALADGVCGERAATGVMMPGVDKAGRYFPLALVVLPEDPVGGGDDGPSGRAWFEGMEDLALSALDPALDVEGFVRAVAGLPPPPPVATPLAGRDAIWWTAGGETFAARTVRTDGLPPADRFAGFLDGDWNRPGPAGGDDGDGAS